jgi:hypothetical protein
MARYLPEGDYLFKIEQRERQRAARLAAAAAQPAPVEKPTDIVRVVFIPQGKGYQATVFRRDLSCETVARDHMPAKDDPKMLAAGLVNQGYIAGVYIWLRQQ